MASTGGPAAKSGLDLVSSMVISSQLFVGHSLAHLFRSWQNLILKDKFALAYTCLHRACGMDFPSEDSLRSHIADTHLNKESSAPKLEFKLAYKCLYSPKECGRKLDSLNQIMNHICKSHLIGGIVQDGVEYRTIFVVSLFTSLSSSGPRVT